MPVREGVTVAVVGLCRAALVACYVAVGSTRCKPVPGVLRQDHVPLYNSTALCLARLICVILAARHGTALN